MFESGGVPNCPLRGSVELWLCRHYPARVSECLAGVAAGRFEIYDTRIKAAELGSAPVDVFYSAYRMVHRKLVPRATRQPRPLRSGDLVVLTSSKREKLAALLANKSALLLARRQQPGRCVIEVGRNTYLVMLGFV